MHSLDCIKKKIEEIIATSPVPEDPRHARDTLDWLLRLEPDADEALQIAALGHDIERAIETRKVRREAYQDYDAFKAAHARNSAQILKEIMQECQASPALIEEVYALVCQHEQGGNRRADLLREADSLSFFSLNLPFYFARHDREETLRRCRWGYRRLSERGKELVARLTYPEPALTALVKACISLEEGLS
ncbi:MAG: DUF4202 family protein [Nitrospinota bacterium]|nr:MAG: DUF4202 family protein [Nitrospinota bacterium]